MDREKIRLMTFKDLFVFFFGNMTESVFMLEISLFINIILIYNRYIAQKIVERFDFMTVFCDCSTGGLFRLF